MQNLFMRVRDALPVLKPLRCGGFIADSGGVRTWVKFKYERLLIFCHYCGLLGHDLQHCASHYVVEKNGGEIAYQYGDWLKVAVGRLRSPPQKEAIKEETGAWKPENLGDDFSQYDDQAKNKGIHSKSQMMRSEKNDVEEVDDNPISREVVDKRETTPSAVDMAVSNSQPIEGLLRLELYVWTMG